jgi:hypothetical protein
MSWIGRKIRSLFIKRVIFSGDFADILAQRRKWVKENSVIIISIKDYEKKLNRKGKLKNNSMTLLYVEDNALMYAIGFKKTFVHRVLNAR